VLMIRSLRSLITRNGSGGWGICAYPGAFLPLMQVHELGHLVLYVKDLERSRRFYKDVLGWAEITGDQPLQMPAAAFTSGRTHHELLLIEVGPNAAAVPEGRRLGLYHFGLKVGTT